MGWFAQGARWIANICVYGFGVDEHHGHQTGLLWMVPQVSILWLMGHHVYHGFGSGRLLTMSEQARHEIIGRTLEEHGEAMRKLAALEAKSRSYAGCMRTVAEELSPARPDFVRVDTGGFGSDSEEHALEKYPNRTEVAELFGEVQAAKDKIEELAKSLRKMGVSV